jgi:hypothetical protein
MIYIYDLPNNRLVVNWPKPKLGDYGFPPDGPSDSMLASAEADLEQALAAFNNGPSIPCSPETPKLWANRNGEEIPEGEYEVKGCGCRITEDCPRVKGKWFSRCLIAYPVTKEAGLPMVDLPQPIGDFILDQKDLPYMEGVTEGWAEKIVTTCFHVGWMDYLSKEPGTCRGLDTAIESLQTLMISKGLSNNKNYAICQRK